MYAQLNAVHGGKIPHDDFVCPDFEEHEPIKEISTFADLSGWLATQPIPGQTFSYRDSAIPRYLAWAASSILDRAHRKQ